jgi:hypothetical protein
MIKGGPKYSDGRHAHGLSYMSSKSKWCDSWQSTSILRLRLRDLSSSEQSYSMFPVFC